APRLGFLSADSWVLIATYVRNFLLNLLLLLPGLLGVMFVTRLVLLVFFWDGVSDTWDPTLACGLAILAALSVPLVTILPWLRRLASVRAARPGKKAGMKMSFPYLHGLILVPVFAAALLASWFILWEPEDPLAWSVVERRLGVDDAWRCAWEAEWLPDHPNWRNALLYGAFFGPFCG